MYKKGPISLDPRFITLRNKIGSGFFGDVFLATIPLRNSQSRLHPHPSSSLSPAASSSLPRDSTVAAAAAAVSNNANNNIANYIQVAVKVLKDSSLFNSRVSPGMMNPFPCFSFNQL